METKILEKLHSAEVQQALAALPFVSDWNIHRQCRYLANSGLLGACEPGAVRGRVHVSVGLLVHGLLTTAVIVSLSLSADGPTGQLRDY